MPNNGLIFYCAPARTKHDIDHSNFESKIEKLDFELVSDIRSFPAFGKDKASGGLFKGLNKERDITIE